MCVKLAGVGLNVCECAGKAEGHPEKTSFITQLSGKGTVESLLFELVGPAHFYAGRNAVTWLYSRDNPRE